MDITLKNVKLSFASGLFTAKAVEKGQDEKYSVCCLIPKDDTELHKRLKTLINETINKGITDNKFKEIDTKKNNFKRLLRDGDADDAREEYRGFWYLNVSSKNQPSVCKMKEGVLYEAEEKEAYSGRWASVAIRLFPYNNTGAKGVSGELKAVVLGKNDEPLAGSSFDITAAFEDIEDTEEEVEEYDNDGI